MGNTNKEHAIQIKTFLGTSLASLHGAIQRWQEYVNDEEYYTILGTDVVSGNNEYLCILTFRRTN